MSITLPFRATFLWGRDDARFRFEDG